MQHLGLTDELIISICEHVRAGTAFRDSYLLAGVNKHTGSEWRKQAIKDEKAGETAETSIYVKLSQAMDKAKAEFIRSLVDCVKAAGKEPKHWQAAMTLAERRDPDNYSRFSQVKKYDDLGLNPSSQSPLELVSGILGAVIDGKISSQEGKQMSEIIGNIIKVEENGKGWAIINELKQAMKK
jgi:hypothetical protein